MDAADQDFGAGNGVAFNLPGATPSTLMAAISKNGLFSLLDPANLGGMDGHLAQLTVSLGAAFATPVAYRTALGTYVLFLGGYAESFCPAGTALQPSGAYSVAVAITPGSPPTAKIAWCQGGSYAGFMVTTSDGTHDPIAWLNSGGALYGFDGDTGALRAAVQDLICQPPGRTSPIAVKGRIIQATNGRLCSYSLH